MIGHGFTSAAWLPRHVFIIAEAGVNHNGDLHLAKQLVDAAVACGADAVKFQTFKPEQLLTRKAAKAQYQKGTTDPAESQYEMLCRLELSPRAHRELFEYCAQKKILFLSTPFEEASADFLQDLGVPIFKVASGEVTNLPFLEHLARKERPLILSTGMSTLGEVETAVQTIRQTGNSRLALLHCVSNYPADPAVVNLRAMGTMSAAFRLPVGYSDHTLGIEVCLAAVALGATIIEKHLTLDQNLPGPDQKCSAEPREFSALVLGIRKIESSLGDGQKRPVASEADTAAAARKSLVAASDLPEGTVLSPEHIVVRRPGTGLPVGLLPCVKGRRLRRAIQTGDLLDFSMLE